MLSAPAVGDIIGVCPLVAAGMAAWVAAVVTGPTMAFTLSLLIKRVVTAAASVLSDLLSLLIISTV